MNSRNVSTSHHTGTGTSSSSKTVAAILKQAKDQQNPKDAARLSQQQKKKGKNTSELSQSSSTVNQLGLSKNAGSPVGHVTSPSVAVSSPMASSAIRGMSPLGKEHNHPVTTKGSSLSRDLSPSRITAQMVKVMADTTTTTTPNLLRSALQGNMPDPMSIRSSSKTEGGVVTVVTSTSGTLPVYNPSSRKSANLASLPTSSSSGHQSHTFSKILTSVSGAGGFLGQQSLDPIDSKLGSPSKMTTTLSTVENLLASSDGTIQTVNVSHIPKSLTPNSTSIGTSCGSTSSTLSTSPRPSPLSAMEVAQQIKMEANGQKSNALRPGMQQQLRSQIQSSRSIDAQLAPKQMAATFSRGQPSAQRASPKEGDPKPLEASMPLLASKLSPTVVASAVSRSGVSPISQVKLQHQQQLSGEPSVLLSSLSSSSSGLSSISVPSAMAMSCGSSSVAATTGRKQTQSTVRLAAGSPKQHQDNLQRLQQQMSGSVLQAKLGQSESLGQGDQPWMFHSPQHMSTDSQHPQPTAISLAAGLGDLLSGSSLDRQQALERLIQPGIAGSERMVQTVMAGRGDNHTQTMQHVFQGGNPGLSTVSSVYEAVPVPAVSGVDSHQVGMYAGKGGGQPQVGVTSSQLMSTLSKSRPGESKQTAIDVDLDIGQLPSITGDGASLPPGSVPVTHHRRVKEVKAGPAYPTLGQQLFNTTLASSSGWTTQTLPKSRDSQAFVPVQAAKTSSSFTLHSIQTTSSLAHIPKPIMHVSTSSSSSLSSLSSSSFSTVASANLPPPPDYTPPPPYPVKLNQQYQHGQPVQQQQQQQQQGFSTKAGQAGKQVVQNPFTFPVSGVRVHPDHDSHGLLSYSLTGQQTNVSGSSEAGAGMIHELSANFKTEPGQLGKSQSDISALRRRHTGQSQTIPMSDMPRLVPQVMQVKQEDEGEYSGYNHVGEMSSAEEKKPVVQPFNQRISNLSCFPVMNPTYRAAYRSHAVAVQRARSGVITNTAKSLDILRQNLQHMMNKEITQILKKYTDKYFQPALDNIRNNNSDSVLGDDHLNYVCRAILEEAKSEYMLESERRSVTPSDFPDNVSESGSLSGRRLIFKRNRISDSDSEKGSDGGFKRKTARKKGRPTFQGSGRVTPSKTHKAGDAVKREGPKWDPERLKPETLFVMGARANKALGLGNTRGRLYIRHPDVFKYIGDQDDKLWLYEHNLMPATGGKAYMLLLEDIEELSRSDDYRESPGLMMHECVGFTVPDWMLVKMKEQMNALRSDGHKRSYSPSPASDVSETRPKILPFSAFSDTSTKEEAMVSPADTEEMDFLSTADNDDTRPSSAISPFTVTGAFEDGVSPTPSELDPMDDHQPVPSLFS